VVNPVDTTGCGDAFTAALSVLLLAGKSLEEIAEFANLLGAYLATKKGAVPDYTLEELQEFGNSRMKRSTLNFLDDSEMK
jgi:ribokinase